jgi:hypothetical protein
MTALGMAAAARIQQYTCRKRKMRPADCFPHQCALSLVMPRERSGREATAGKSKQRGFSSKSTRGTGRRLLFRLATLVTCGRPGVVAMTTRR